MKEVYQCTEQKNERKKENCQSAERKEKSQKEKKLEKVGY